jgi:hypothetical protein
MYGFNDSLILTGGLTAVALKSSGVVDITALETSPIFGIGHKILGRPRLVAPFAALTPIIIRKGALRTQPVHSIGVWRTAT